MKKTAVVYKSKYGSTEKYAKWIAEDLDADIHKADKIGINALLLYDTIVYCGGLYAGGMLGFKRIKKHYDKLKDKNLVVVAVGATLKREDEIEHVKNQNLTPEMADNVKFFILRGGLNYKKMNIMDRLLMYLLVRSIRSKKPETLDNDSKGLLATYGKVVDFTNRKSIYPIVEYVKLLI